MSYPTSPMSPIRAKDLHALPRRALTPHKGAFIKREDIEAVFKRCGLVNTDNGTWRNRFITLDLPHVDKIPRGQAKILMEQARENRTLASPMRPLRDRGNFQSPLGHHKRTQDYR